MKIAKFAIASFLRIFGIGITVKGYYVKTKSKNIFKWEFRKLNNDLVLLETPMLFTGQLK
jgi:hypothetical protein